MSTSVVEVKNKYHLFFTGYPTMRPAFVVKHRNEVFRMQFLVDHSFSFACHSRYEVYFKSFGTEIHM